jgi:hypothetical protein
MGEHMLIHALALSLVLAGTNDTFDIFTDKGDMFVRAGKNKGLKMGSEVKLLGDKIGDTDERRVVGKANVIEVFDTIARVVPDDEAKKAKPVAARFGEGDAAAPAAAANKPAACPDAKPGAPQISQHWGMTNDHFFGKCCGTKIEVVTHGTTLGASLKLLVDGKTAEEQEPFSGNNVTLHGTAANGAKVAVEIVVGAYGGDYRLKVNGQTCELVHD